MSGGYHAALWPLGIAAPFMTPMEPMCILVVQPWATTIAPGWEPTQLLLAPDAMLVAAPDSTIVAPRWEATLINAEGCG